MIRCQHWSHNLFPHVEKPVSVDWLGFTECVPVNARLTVCTTQHHKRQFITWMCGLALKDWAPSFRRQEAEVHRPHDGDEQSQSADECHISDPRLQWIPCSPQQFWPSCQAEDKRHHMECRNSCKANWLIMNGMWLQWKQQNTLTGPGLIPTVLVQDDPESLYSCALDRRRLSENSA